MLARCGKRLPGDDMIRCAIIVGLAAGVVMFGGSDARAATSAVELNPFEKSIDQGVVDPAPAPRPARSGDMERPPTGNPLWAVPLRSLSATRERPIFSPSRRPPAPAIVAAPYTPPARPPAPKPVEPDHPLLSLVGTIVGGGGGIGVFVDQATKSVVRLRTGQGHDGWILRTVQGRDATFDKDRQTAKLSLPAPGGEQSAAAPPGFPMPIGQPGLPTPAPAGSGTWLDGDGQLIAPPPRSMFPGIGGMPAPAPTPAVAVTREP